MRDTLIAIGIEPTEGFIKRVLDCVIAVYIRVCGGDPQWGKPPDPPLRRNEGGMREEGGGGIIGDNDKR